MASYTGRLLRVNLSQKIAEVETIPSDLCELFVGGRGFGIAYLYKEQPPNVDPLGEENRLLFSRRTSGRHAGAVRIALDGLHQKPPYRRLCTISGRRRFWCVAPLCGL